MKRIAAALTACILCFGLTACDSSEKDMEITIPSAFTQNSVLSDDFEAKETVINDDGSVTYIFERSQYDEMLKELRDELDETIEDIGASIGAEEDTSIKAIQCSDDYSKITFTVDYNAYQTSLNDGIGVMSVGSLAYVYQLYLTGRDDKVKVTVEIVDEASSEVKSTTDFKEVMNQLFGNE